MKPGLRHVPPAHAAEHTGVFHYFSDPHSHGSAALCENTAGTGWRCRVRMRARVKTHHDYGHE
jgi:hypothetical protein